MLAIEVRTVICHTYVVVHCVKVTLAARVSLSPDSPTQMFKHNFRIRNSRIGFLAGSFLIFFPAGEGLTAAGYTWSMRN